MKLIGLIIGLFVMYNSMNSAVFKDLQTTMNAATNIGENIQQLDEAGINLSQVENFNQQLDQLSSEFDNLERIDYVVGNKVISLEQLKKYFSLKIGKLDTPDTKALLILAYLFLVVSLISFIAAIGIAVAFLIKIIASKNRKDFLREKLRTFLVWTGSFSSGFALFLLGFLRVLNA